MFGLTLLVVLGVTILIGSAIAARTRIALSIVLLAAGSVLGFIPALRQVSLAPDVVLLLFLPALLYWESITTSLREIRDNIRGVLLTSTVLVVLTAAAAAGAAHLVGIGWTAAWVLGATVAPTDATATAALVRGLPRRIVTTLRAESLVNDGTALVVLALGIQAAEADAAPTPAATSGLFALSYLGGIVAGGLVALTATLVRRRVDSALYENVVTVLTPFTAYLLAELVDASGVLAVVICGLIMSQTGPQIGRPDTRFQTTAFWSLATYLLNGALFVLVGIEIQTTLRALRPEQLLIGLAAIGVVTLTLVAVRFAFLFASAYLIRALDRRPRQQQLRLSNRARTVLGTAGFRGAVSIAAALSIPARLGDGSPFPQRDLVLFVVAGTVAVTLIGQGLLLPAVIRWARIPADDAVDRELQTAETTALQAALSDLDTLARDSGAGPEEVDRSRTELTAHLDRLHDETDHDGDRYLALRLTVIRRERVELLRLRNRRDIDDIVMRQVLARLDAEEIRIDQQQTTTGHTSRPDPPTRIPEGLA